jgi:hypothetical protein
MMKSEEIKENEYIADLRCDLESLQNFVTENVVVARLIRKEIIDIKAEIEFYEDWKDKP